MNTSYKEKSPRDTKFLKLNKIIVYTSKYLNILLLSIV